MKVAIIKGPGVIAPYVMEGYIKGFSKTGHQVLKIDTSKGFSQQHVNLIKDFNPDFVLGYGFNGFILTNHQSGRETVKAGLFRLMGIPVVALHYDNPFFGMLPEVFAEIKSYPEYYYNFIWDRCLLNLYNQSGMPPGYPIMLAADPDEFFTMEIEPEPETLAFVGGVNLQNVEFNQDHPLVKQFMETVVRLKLERFEIPLIQICFQALERSNFSEIKQIYLNDPCTFWTKIYYQIHAKGSPLLRYFILNSIEDVNLHVYGATNWVKENLILHDRVPYGRELSKVYQQYAINLNISSIQLETSVNNRVFDVFASKGFLLSDYKQEMELIFPDHWQEITFRNLDELGSKGEYFLTHDKERRELTEELYHIVLKRHTYQNRAQEIIEVIQNK